MPIIEATPRLAQEEESAESSKKIPWNSIQIACRSNRHGLTLTTIGAAQRPMDVPSAWQGKVADRCEFCLQLPPAFSLQTAPWPLQALGDLTDLAWQPGTWLAWGHTVEAAEQPLIPGTAYCAWILLESTEPTDGTETWQLFPLYREELEQKLASGTEALLAKLREQGLLTPVLQLQRACAFAR